MLIIKLDHTKQSKWREGGREGRRGKGGRFLIKYLWLVFTCKLHHQIVKST